MPIYEYQCETSSLHFELKRRFGEDRDNVCPRCGSRVRRVFSPVLALFKCSGFYITDRRKDGGHAEDEAKGRCDEDGINKSYRDKKEDK
jgi:putative FmdB family regulatory protein